MKRIISINPSNGKVLGKVTITPNSKIKKMVEQAKKVQLDWAALPVKKRISIVKKLVPIINGRKSKIAKLIHREMGKFAVSLPLDIIFFYGEEMRTAYDEAIAAPDGESARTDRQNPHFLWSENMDNLLKQAANVLKTGDLLLLKGSRSIELERVYQYLFRSKKEKTLC